MSLHIDLAIVGVSMLLSLIVPDQEVRIVALCGLGGMAGGLCGALLFPVTEHKKLAARWVINVTLAVFLAPVLTWWLLSKYADIPYSLASFVSGGVVGCFGASILTIFIPWALEWFKQFLNAKSNK